MNKQKIAEENKILEIVTGSFLYGTNSETSDKDYIGVFLPSIPYILGFKTIEEVDFSIKNKNEQGKNTEKATDRKLYEFRKYIKLAMECNPNIVETLFVNSGNIVFCNDIGKELLKRRHLFPYKGLKQKFLGYAFSQKHKMVIKKDNYFDLVSAYDYLQKFDDKKFILEVVIDSKCPHFFKIRKDDMHNTKFICIGDLNIIPSHTVSNVRNILQNRINAVGNREELLLKYGYDTKFGMHLVRLMLEGVELLKTGEIKFPLSEANMLKDIREGKWTIDKILNFSYELEKEIESLYISSKIQSKPDINYIEQFTIKTLKNILLKEDK